MDVSQRIAKVILERLELEGLTLDSFPSDAALFAPIERSGLGLDSLASLEIIAGLTVEFGLPFDDIGEEDMLSVSTLAAYVERAVAVAS